MTQFSKKPIEINGSTRLKESISVYGLKSITTLKEQIFKEQKRLEDFGRLLDGLNESKIKDFCALAMKNLSYFDKIKTDKVKIGKDTLIFQRDGSFNQILICYEVDLAGTGILANESLYVYDLLGSDPVNESPMGFDGYAELESRNVTQATLTISFTL